MIEFALDAIRRGLRVFPCKEHSKDPLGGKDNPHGCVDATSDLDKVRWWWTKYPTSNVGVCGQIILDVDHGLSSEREGRNFIGAMGLTETLCIRTGNRSGFRVQFHYAGSTANCSYERFGCGGEVRCRNEYGLWHGSIHPSGARYELLVDLPLAQWPEGLSFRTERPIQIGDSSDGIETNIAAALDKFEGMLETARVSKEGKRNWNAHRVTWFAARCALAGILDESETKQRIFDAVQPLYKPKERNVRRMLRDSWRYGLRKGKLRLSLYPADVDKLCSNISAEEEDKRWRLLTGNISDFGSAVEARDYFRKVLEQTGFSGGDYERVMNYSQLEAYVVRQIITEARIREFLK
jgi:hypothetical protein